MTCVHAYNPSTRFQGVLDSNLKSSHCFESTADYLGTCLLYCYGGTYTIIVKAKGFPFLFLFLLFFQTQIVSLNHLQRCSSMNMMMSGL